MEPRYWQDFCTAIGHPEFAGLQHATDRHPEIRATLEALFASKPRAHWLSLLEEAGTQYAPVNTIAEALQDPHLIARGMICDTKGSDGRKLNHIGQPVRLETADTGPIRNLGRSPGADTEEVLAAWNVPPALRDAALKERANSKP